MCIMDNIDLKEKTFTYDNIFDGERKTMHCIVQIIIQYKFPKPLSKVISEDISDIDNDTSFKVGSSLYVEKELLHCFNLFNKLLNKRNRVFDIQDIMKEYENKIESNYHLPVLNIVILKPDNNPNNTDDVHNATFSLNKTHPGFHFLLSGWHTRYWIGHKIGIKHENWNMQVENLKAFTSLFAVAVHINIMRPEHYFAYDEAIKRVDIMYIKQNIGKVLRINKELKLQMTSVQAERECLSMVLDQFVDEKLFITNDHILQSRQSVLWNLSDFLLDAFLALDLTKHELFQNTSQNYESVFNKLFTCYKKGQKRIYKIYQQDIKKSEEQTTSGCRAHDIAIYPINIQKKDKVYKSNSDSNYSKMQSYMNECSIQ
ncbi:16385_t:CDS:2 [Cetraspora pellucida]|uniref:16385_t:CDS:1 n=1 Tax=Cetraspora pellucida TaxID=1433469 RepID=A0ACA9N2K1_9GLOM|nr:16385_t:CDS:2 [Cetraspora pellucida]